MDLELVFEIEQELAPGTESRVDHCTSTARLITGCIQPYYIEPQLHAASASRQRSSWPSGGRVPSSAKGTVHNLRTHGLPLTLGILRQGPSAIDRSQCTSPSTSVLHLSTFLPKLQISTPLGHQVRKWTPVFPANNYHAQHSTIESSLAERTGLQRVNHLRAMTGSRYGTQPTMVITSSEVRQHTFQHGGFRLILPQHALQLRHQVFCPYIARDLGAELKLNYGISCWLRGRP